MCIFLFQPVLCVMWHVSVQRHTGRHVLTPTCNYSRWRHHQPLNISQNSTKHRSSKCASKKHKSCRFLFQTNVRFKSLLFKQLEYRLQLPPKSVSKLLTKVERLQETFTRPLKKYNVALWIIPAYCFRKALLTSKDNWSYIVWGSHWEPR